MVTLARLVQPKKAARPIVVTPFPPMVTLVRPVLKKALSSMSITLSGMVTLARLVQPKKASLPMVVTLSPMVTFLRLVKPLNHDSIFVVFMVRLARLVQPSKA
jgi:hypothetical protein